MHWVCTWRSWRPWKMFFLSSCLRLMLGTTFAHVGFLRDVATTTTWGSTWSRASGTICGSINEMQGPRGTSTTLYFGVTAMCAGVSAILGLFPEFFTCWGCKQGSPGPRMCCSLSRSMSSPRCFDGGPLRIFRIFPHHPLEPLLEGRY